jgi:transglutaminase superfamily protein
MTKLYWTESGRVVPTLCEELTTYRRARKIMDLPPTRLPAQVFILARAYPNTGSVLRVTVNGHGLPPIGAAEPPIYRWYSLDVPSELLVNGSNIFELWTEASAMNAWSLALENGHRDPRSFVSLDQGHTWRQEGLGYLGVSRGEYVVRIRLAEGQDEPPEPVAVEEPGHFRLASLGQLIPPAVSSAPTALERVRALTAWVATSWEYRHSGDASLYAPWDPETIIAWGQSKRGHDGRLPIVMCVHYGVTMLAACQAVGLEARLAVFIDAIDGVAGHFLTEVWLPELNKWVLVDPNLDVIFSRDQTPLSVAELRQVGPDLAPFIVAGPGYEYQSQRLAMVEWIRDIYMPARWLAHRAVWSRADLLSRPELSPPGHGSTAYCETELIWEAKDLAQGFGMFPYFGTADYFDAPPAGLSSRLAVGAQSMRKSG